MIEYLGRVYGAVAHLSTRRRRAVEALLLLTVAVLILVETRMLWFFSDDWAFILGRRELRLNGRTADFLWYPHNEHLMGGLAVIYSTMVALFGISSQFPFMVLLMIGHVAVTWMVGVVIQRAGIRWEWSLAAMVWLGFFGSGNENIIWPVQIGYMWSLALSMGAMLIATRRPAEGQQDKGARRREVVLGASASLLFVLALFIGPTAIVVMLGTGAVLAAERPFRRNWLRALAILGAPTALYLWWFATYGRRFSAPWGHPARMMPAYFVRGVTNALDHAVAIRGGGTVLGLIAVALTAGLWRRPAARRLLIFGATGFVAFFIMNAYGRAGLGTVQSTSPRYVGVAGVFAIPVFAVGASELLRRVRASRYAAAPTGAVAVLAVVALLGAHAVWRNANDIHAARRAREAVLYEVRPVIEIAALHALSPIVDPGTQPEPKYDPDVTMGRLAEIRRSGSWNPRTDWPLEHLLSGSLQFGVVVRTDGPTAASNNAGLAVIVATGVVGRPEGCLELAVSPEAPASVTFAGDAPAGFVSITGLDPAGAVSMDAILASGTVRSARRDLGVVSGAPVWFGTDPFVGETVLRFTTVVPLRVSVCGIAAK